MLSHRCYDTSLMMLFSLRMYYMMFTKMFVDGISSGYMYLFYQNFTQFILHAKVTLHDIIIYIFDPQS